jgi:predicted alpha/beta-hydrolase family hydrolase
VQEAEPQTLVVGSGATARNIAYRARQEAQEKKPGVVWLSGFMSDMASTKAAAVADWAATHGLSSTRFDYSGPMERLAAGWKKRTPSSRA